MTENLMLFRCYGNEEVKTENQIARRGTPFSFCPDFSGGQVVIRFSSLIIN